MTSALGPRAATAVLLVATTGAWLAGCATTPTPRATDARPAVPASWPSAEGAPAVTTLLFFGLSSDDGVGVSDQAWRQFLSESMTPRFPDGFTVVDAYGQARDPGGEIVRESSKLVVIVHPAGGDVEQRLQEVAGLYKSRFHQRSVLRVDLPSSMGADPIPRSDSPSNPHPVMIPVGP